MIKESMIKCFLRSYWRIMGAILIGFLIAWLAYYLRSQQFSSFPPVGDTRDEVKYTFNGISLLKRGVPESWSWWDDYGEFPVQNIRGSDYRLVKPYFDDPPLFAVLSGGYAIWKGMDSYEKVDAGALRWPMLKIGALNVFLLFLVVYLLSGLAEATVAGLIYATWPTVVLASRLPLAENFLITLSLLSLLFLLFFLKKKHSWGLFLTAIIAGSAALVKQTGIYIPAAVVFLLLACKKKKAAFITAAVAFLFFLTWFAYGYVYDWPLFLRLQSIFSGREIRLPTMIISLFDTFRISEKTMSTDAWQIWGWLSVIVFSFLKKRRQGKMTRLALPVFVGSYLVVFAIMSGHSKGWYRFPFHSFLSWAMAASFVYLLQKPNFLPSLFFVALAGFSSWIFGTGEAFWGRSQVKIYQFAFPLLMAPFLFYSFDRKPIFKRLAQLILLGVFVAIVIFNIRTILFHQDQFWY